MCFTLPSLVLLEKGAARPWEQPRFRLAELTAPSPRLCPRALGYVLRSQSLQLPLWNCTEIGYLVIEIVVQGVAHRIEFHQFSALPDTQDNHRPVGEELGGGQCPCTYTSTHTSPHVPKRTRTHERTHAHGKKLLMMTTLVKQTSDVFWVSFPCQTLRGVHRDVTSPHGIFRE